MKEEDASNEAFGRIPWKKTASSNRPNHRIIETAAARSIHDF